MKSLLVTWLTLLAMIFCVLLILSIGVVLGQTDNAPLWVGLYITFLVAVAVEVLT